MQRGTTEMDREVPVKLDEHEIAERGEIIASKMLRVKQLRKKRREDFRNLTAQIDAELDNMQQIAETIMHGIEARKQSDLRFGDAVVPSSGEATAALGEIAKRAPEYHKNGELCKRDVCKRRHLSAEQARANGVVLEGDPIAPEGDGQTEHEICAGCEKPLEGKVDRYRGLCGTCHASKGGDPLEGTPQAAPVEGAAIEGTDDQGPQNAPESPSEAYTQPSAISSPQDERAHAHANSLNAEDVDEAGGEGTTKPAPDTEETPAETPALGGEAGA